MLHSIASLIAYFAASLAMPFAITAAVHVAKYRFGQTIPLVVIALAIVSIVPFAVLGLIARNDLNSRKRCTTHLPPISSWPMEGSAVSEAFAKPPTET